MKNIKNAYYKERRRVLAAINRAKKEGFSGVEAPKIPKKITENNVEELRRMTTVSIYKDMTKPTPIELYNRTTGALLKRETVNYSYYRRKHYPEEMNSPQYKLMGTIITTLPGMTYEERKSTRASLKNAIEKGGDIENKYIDKNIGKAKKKKAKAEKRIDKLNDIIYDPRTSSTQKINAAEEKDELTFIPEKSDIQAALKDARSIYKKLQDLGAIDFRVEPVNDDELPYLEYYTYIRDGKSGPYSSLATEWNEKRSDSFLAANNSTDGSLQIKNIMNDGSAGYDAISVLTEISAYVILNNSSENWTIGNFPSLKYDMFYNPTRRHFYYIIPIFKK